MHTEYYLLTVDVTVQGPVTLKKCGAVQWR